MLIDLRAGKPILLIGARKSYWGVKAADVSLTILDIDCRLVYKLMSAWG